MNQNPEYNDIEEFMKQFYEDYGQYDLNNFNDIIDWAKHVKVIDPNNMTHEERIAITIRLLASHEVGARIGYQTFKKLYFDSKLENT